MGFDREIENARSNGCAALRSRLGTQHATRARTGERVMRERGRAGRRARGNIAERFSAL